MFIFLLSIVSALPAARQAFEPRAFAFFPSGLDRPDGFIQFDFTGEQASRIEVRLANFPENRGPFSYHIHEAQVPALVTDIKDCAQAKAHFDPLGRGETSKCDAKDPNSCQAGDLSGKFGQISGEIKTSQEFREVYQDVSLNWNRASSHFFGNRSVVIHAADKTRLACSNILFL